MGIWAPLRAEGPQSRQERTAWKAQREGGLKGSMDLLSPRREPEHTRHGNTSLSPEVRRAGADPRSQRLEHSEWWQSRKGRRCTTRNTQCLGSQRTEFKSQCYLLEAGINFSEPHFLIYKRIIIDFFHEVLLRTECDHACEMTSLEPGHSKCSNDDNCYYHHSEPGCTK